MFSNIKLILREIRINQWIKNFLVFAPLFFSYSFFDLNKLYLSIYLFFAFSLLASSIYVINDIVDIEKDRNHPIKKFRPIAASHIQIYQALILIFVLLSIVILISLNFFNLKANISLFLYFVFNILYSFRFKDLAVIDIFLVAFMYILRVIAGASLINVEISQWLILVTFFLALFLVLGKRKAEYNASKGMVFSSRKVLNEYNEIFLNNSMNVIIAGVILSYSLYTVEVNKPYFLYSSFFVFFGMFRYLYLIDKLDKGETPEKLIFQDLILFSTVILWAIYVFIVLYFEIG